MSKRPMKWQRGKAPGTYRSGDFVVCKEGKYWAVGRLSTGEVLIDDCPSKKAAYLFASEEPAKPPKPAPVSSEDSFTLLRQEVGSLAMAVCELRSEVKELAKAIRETSDRS